MGTGSKIEWTEATWNPTVGCTKVSPGCDNCYAEKITNRFGGAGAFDTVVLHPDRLDKPLHWKKPRRVFVNSMSDLFHDDVPDTFIAEVWAVMAMAPQHTFQVLTKRHARMRSILSSKRFRILVQNRSYKRNPYFKPPVLPLPNAWLGVSVEDQKWANIRIPALLGTPAAVRWLSCEPLLGPIDLYETAIGPLQRFPDEPNGETGRIDWVVVGGESGRDARPMHPDWARSLRDQCVSAGVPFFFKQWGEWAPNGYRGIGNTELTSGGRERQIGEPIDDKGHRLIVERMGKKRAGRLLDGRTWDEYPGL